MRRFLFSCAPACLIALSVAGCPATEQDPCASSDDPFILLGDGVGGAFTEFEDGQEVGLSVAPQGGFGVAVLVRTDGLAASVDSKADVRLAVEMDGELVGDFLLEQAALLCQDEGGLISGVVVGFDPGVFSTNDDLVALDGEEVILDVTVTDADGTESNVRKPVVISVEG